MAEGGISSVVLLALPGVNTASRDKGLGVKAMKAIDELKMRCDEALRCFDPMGLWVEALNLTTLDGDGETLYGQLTLTRDHHGLDVLVAQHYSIPGLRQRGGGIRRSYQVICGTYLTWRFPALTMLQ